MSTHIHTPFDNKPMGLKLNCILLLVLVKNEKTLNKYDFASINYYEQNIWILNPPSADSTDY